MLPGKLKNLKLQKTIVSQGRLSGKGLFSGKEARVTFRSAEVDTGIVFVRTDLSEPVRIPAVAANIANRDRRTAIKKGSVSIETPEHCLAALYVLDIDNIIIEIDGMELPGFDGSCEEYFKVLQKCDTVEQQAERKELVVTESIEIVDGDKSIYALPYNSNLLSITYDLDYTQHTGIGRQLLQMQTHGIGTHLTPREILVINSDGPIKNSYRFSDECVRHKIVVLVGRRISGRIIAYKSGHLLNQRLARELTRMAHRSDRSSLGVKALLDIRRIQKILPHRYPFLLVDKIIDVEGDKKITGIKNVTFNEQFFQGHFPGTPIMPGVLIIEALAQVSGLLFAQTLEHTGKLAVLLTMDGVKMRKSVVPGDQLILISEVEKVQSRAAKCNCIAKVQGDVVAEAQLKFMLVDDEMV